MLKRASSWVRAKASWHTFRELENDAEWDDIEQADLREEIHALAEHVRITGKLGTSQLWEPASGDGWGAFVGRHGSYGFTETWEQIQAADRARREQQRRIDAEAYARQEAQRQRWLREMAEARRPPPPRPPRPPPAPPPAPVPPAVVQEELRRMAAAVQVAERAALEHAKRREMAARLEKQRVEMWLSRQGEWRARRVAQFRTDIAWSKEDRDAAMTAKMRWLARNNMFHGDRMARVTVSRENQLQVAGIIVLLNPGQPKWLPLSIAIHARDVTEAGLLD